MSENDPKDSKGGKDVLLMEKARSVIDAVLALNRLGSDDETDTSNTTSRSKYNSANNEPADARASIASESDQQSLEATSAKPSTSLYWLSDDLDDFNGLTFPQKMHHVLRSVEDQDAISWLPSGRSFVVRDQKIFSDRVLPKYFGKNVAYTSFTRRLVRWGWQNIAKGTYFCKNFTRDNPERCLLMTYNAKVSNKSAGGVGDSDAPTVQQLEAAIAVQELPKKEAASPPIKRRRDSGNCPKQSSQHWLPKTGHNVAAGSIAAARKADPLNLELQSQLHQYHQQQQFLAQAQAEQRILAQTRQFAQEAGIPLHALFPNMTHFGGAGLNNPAAMNFNAKTHSANVNAASTMLNNMELAKQALVSTGEIMTPLKLELMKKQIEVDELRRKAAIEEMNMRKALDDAIQVQRNAGQLPRPNVVNNSRQRPNNGNKKGPSWVTDNARAA